MADQPNIGAVASGPQGPPPPNTPDGSKLPEIERLRLALTRLAAAAGTAIGANPGEAKRKAYIAWNSERYGPDAPESNAWRAGWDAYAAQLRAQREGLLPESWGPRDV